MGRDLHYSILKFLEKRLTLHSAVSSWSQFQNDDHFAYKIRRLRHDDEVVVVLSDQYLFTDFDLENRPNIECDYILVARPEAGFSVSPSFVAETKIGVGKIGEMMGALNLKRMWQYVPPTEEEKRERARKRSI